MNPNIQTVQRIYEAFGRGDFAAILEPLHPDVEWEYGQGANVVPYLQRREGREGVLAFFQALGAHLRLDRFEVRDLLAGDGVVVALLGVGGVSLRSGARVDEEDEAHIWRFDGEGRVVRFRHGVDTAQHERAFLA